MIDFLYMATVILIPFTLVNGLIKHKGYTGWRLRMMQGTLAILLVFISAVLAVVINKMTGSSLLLH